MIYWTPRFSSKVKTKYMQIVEALAEDIANGLLADGTRLPSQRQIAKALDIDLTTVTRALNEASNRGIIEAKRGYGTHVRQTAQQKEGSYVHSELDLSMNIAPQPAFLNKKFAQKINELLLNEPGLSLGYQESNHSPYHLNGAFLWLKSYLGSIEKERIAIAAGAQNALFSLCNMLFRPDSLICAGQYTYPGLKSIVANQRLRLKPLAMDNEGIIPTAFSELCEQEPPAGIYLIPTLDNPTTTIMPDARRDEIVAIARKFDVKIIEDDPYSVLVEEPPAAFVFKAPERTWHISTLSKSLSPSLRVAYVLCPGFQEREQLATVLRTTALMPSPLTLALASTLIKTGDAEKILAAIRKEIELRQLIAKKILANYSFNAHSMGHHLWLFLPNHLQAKDFSAYARQFGLAIVPSYLFAIDEANPVNAVRISLGAAATEALVKKSLQRLVELMQQSFLPQKILV
ncbi:PLP-dependent aminotransferase family protein [Legionella pneumophila]|nr:PLP-dependent aminotransferase family protein [Legionella pneumophila]HAT8881727.1 aminotransferase class I/II-fold pyridoxal phosphate-dependent enzyme [Legionella pneumophila subsp. pneumophila]RYB43623.1 PLP-dependent aminotransferase family protein [Legionella pneumophila]RYB70307.1 PLP-dependent aminotransferase family protein [Legionella pneumophila]RYB75744.1 PLP-dependent aminotransferase family protein [Legionella pneumophila]RYB75853.1 PLP-dependent aminotransferase family protein